MNKLTTVFTRPACWAKYESDSLNLTHAPLSPGEITQLRNKKPCYESVGGIMTDAGADLLVKTFQERKPDVFLFWCMYMRDGTARRLHRFVKVLKECRRASPGTKFLYGNGNQQGFPDYNVDAYMKAGIDGILINTRDTREIEMYEKYGIPLVDTLYDFGFEPEGHGPEAYPDVTPKWDCMFGGSQTAGPRGGKKKSGVYPYKPGLTDRYANSKERLNLIQAVDRRFRLVVYGKGNWRVKNLRPYAYGKDYIKALRTAKILVNIYHWDLTRYYTKRTVYCGASGRLLVCKYIPGMENDFEDGENIVWFKTTAEALEKIAYYLKHDDERERIAGQQYKHFLEHHSWKARLRTFEKIVMRVIA